MSLFSHHHKWFPDLNSEFLPITQVCLKGGCVKTQVILPWGDCLSGHPIAEHYDKQGRMVPIEKCGGPT
jgi:hypothetical protein